MPIEISTPDAAARLGLPRKTVVRLIYRGLLPARRIGDRWLLAAAAVEQYAAAHAA
jgi:excisionase family DNA binding protein